MLTEARMCSIKLLATACMALACSGCYYLHLAQGQLQLKRSQQPIEALLADPATPVQLRESLATAQAARVFAMEALGLPDNGSYRSFVALGRPYVTWNITVAGEFSLSPRRWCHLIVGCVPYRGYFNEARAERVAKRLRRSGDDVYVGPAIAFSTLGYMRDPVLDSMLARGDAEAAALIFHELAHQAVWIAGDAEFNEAFATVVEVEGARRWLAQQADHLQAFDQRQARARVAEARVVSTREQLQALYQSQLPAPELRQRKQELLSSLASALASQGEWNNARLAAFTTYQRCVPGLTRLLADQANDLPAFYRVVAQLDDVPARRDELCERDQRPARRR